MGLNIFSGDNVKFYDVVIREYSYTEQAMQIGRKIQGSFVYKDNSLHNKFTKKEFVIYKQNKYWLLNQPSIEQKGMLSDNSTLKGCVKYNCEFVSEDVILANTPVCDVNYGDLVVQTRNGSRTFFFFGTVTQYVQMLNANLQFNLTNSGWHIRLQDGFVDSGLIPDTPISFSDNTIEDALKTLYDTYKVPYYIESRNIIVGKPIIEVGHIFKFGQGVGLKNNDRIAKGNKVITRLSGKGSEENLPFRYPIIKDAQGNVIDHPYYRPHLMPTVYVNAVRERVLGINPNAPLNDYYDADETYPTPINPSLPIFEARTYDYIKPTIKEVEYKGERIDKVKGIEYFDNNTLIDDIDKESGEVRQPHFKMQLHPMGFDLYAHAAITGEMTIFMNSGATEGSQFKLSVNSDEFEKNFYEKIDGKIIFNPNLPTRDYTKFPNSTDQSIWITLFKDIETWGKDLIMPNQWQQPKTGDFFVILHIELPQAYIDAAQAKLDAAIKKDLRDNNYDQYEYPLVFDEAFLHKNQSILAQIGTNALVPFKYRGEDDVKKLSVQSISIQYGGILPKYDIKLTDELEVALNQIGKTNETLSDVKNIVVQQQIKGTRQATNFYQGIKKVEQGVFDSEGNNRISVVEALALKANLALIGQPANNFGLENVSIKFVGLDRVEIVSGKIVHFEKSLLSDYWQNNPAVWNIQSKTFTGLDTTKEYYIYIQANRLNNDAIWVVTDEQKKYDSDPNVYFFLWGQAVIVGEERVSFATYGLSTIMGGHISSLTWQSPNFKLTDTDFYGLFIDALNARIYMGEGATFIANSLTIRRPNKDDLELGGFADKTEQDITGLGQDVQDAQLAANNALNKIAEEEQARIDAIASVNIEISDIQKQIDGVVENWFYAYEPFTINYPANTWLTEEEKRNHIGDTFTSISQAPAPDAGKSWRWIEDLTGTFYWIQISDSDAVKALQEAAKAQSTADGKSTTYLTQPTKYSFGDLWILNADWNGYKIGDVLTTSVTRSNFNAADWSKKIRYTDDTVANSKPNNYTTIAQPTSPKVGDTWSPEGQGTSYTYYETGWQLTGDNTRTIINGGVVTGSTFQAGSPDANGNPTANTKAGISGTGNLDSDIRFWAGGSYANRAVAPFRVDQSGKISANDGNIGIFNVVKDEIQINRNDFITLFSNKTIAEANPTTSKIGTYTPSLNKRGVQLEDYYGYPETVGDGLIKILDWDSLLGANSLQLETCSVSLGFSYNQRVGFINEFNLEPFHTVYSSSELQAMGVIDYQNKYTGDNAVVKYIQYIGELNPTFIMIIRKIKANGKNENIATYRKSLPLSKINNIYPPTSFNVGTQTFDQATYYRDIKAINYPSQVSNPYRYYKNYVGSSATITIPTFDPKLEQGDSLYVYYGYEVTQTDYPISSQDYDKVSMDATVSTSTPNKKITAVSTLPFVFHCVDGMIMGAENKKMSFSIKKINNVWRTMINANLPLQSDIALLSPGDVYADNWTLKIKPY